MLYKSRYFGAAVWRVLLWQIGAEWWAVSIHCVFAGTENHVANHVAWQFRQLWAAEIQAVYIHEWG